MDDITATTQRQLANPDHVPNRSTHTKKHGNQAARQPLPQQLSYVHQLMEDVRHFADEANAYQEAGNLEETLAQYILLGTTLEHLMPLLPPTTTTTNRAAKTKYTAELQRVKHVLHSLHQRVQAKSDSFFGCLDASEEDVSDELGDAVDLSVASSSSSQQPSRTGAGGQRVPDECGAVRPVDTLSFERVTLASMVGNDAIKQDIIDGIVRPFQQPLLFKMRRSFLFYGPPGTGKTMFAKASANTLHQMSATVDILFFSPTIDTLKDKHVGGTEQKITRYFQCVHLQALEHARETAKQTVGVIFLDEVDSLARSREDDDPAGTQASATNTLLQMMDGFQTRANIIVMAATNYPWQLDDAVLSRFQEQIYVRLPDTPTIVNLLKYNFSQYYQSVFHSSHQTSPPHHTHNTDPDKLYDIVSACFGIDDDALLYIAKTFHQPSTYSPSNIRDVCTQVFRKNARYAQESSVFYPIQFGEAPHTTVTHTERELLRQLEHMYASATTFQYLNKKYPNMLVQTKPIRMPSPDHQHNHPHKSLPGAHRHERLVYKGQSFICSSHWSPSETLPTDVRQAIEALQTITNLHIYLPESIAADLPASSLPYLLYKPLHATFGRENHQVLHTYGYGKLGATDLAHIQKYAASSLWSIRAWLRTSTRTPESVLTANVCHVFFTNARQQKEKEEVFWSFDVPTDGTHSQSQLCFALDTYAAPHKALDLLKEACYTKSGAERYALWVTRHTTTKGSSSSSSSSSSTSRASESAFLKRVQFEKQKEFSTEFRTQSADCAHANICIQKKMFALHIDLNWFKQVMDTSLPDAIRPTSQKKEIQLFVEYHSGKRQR